MKIYRYDVFVVLNNNCLIGVSADLECQWQQTDRYIHWGRVILLSQTEVVIPVSESHRQSSKLQTHHVLVDPQSGDARRLACGLPE